MPGARQSREAARPQAENPVGRTKKNHRFYIKSVVFDFFRAFHKYGERESLTIMHLQIFSEAYDPIGFLESQCHVKPETVNIVKFAVAGKFGAAFFPCPFLTC